MRLCLRLAIATSLVLAPGISFAQPAVTTKATTAEEIVSRYIAARGGLEKLRLIRTLVFRGPPRPNGRPGRRILRARPFYLNVGAEGNDGAPWEAYDESGLQPRVTDAPGAALRHTAYFDDPLVMTLEPGWDVELTGSERIGDRDAWRLRVTYPDGFVNESFVDKASWLLIARRFTAPVHAFGASVTSQAILGDYRRVNGVLFPYSLREVNVATGEMMDAFTWEAIEANVAVDYAAFSPPPRSATPISRLVNGIYASRHVTADALGWYHDFLRDPATAPIDIQAAIESVGYECLKNGAVATGTTLLEENLRAHPTSARAHFGVGRAYRAAGREADALERFREALRLDPSLDAAKQAIASRALRY
ncbi:MAG TPA: tetratricopeptide repeat protein [Gemmatimonadaceae bacterium]|nr:tetratricopeptide repeat protein [Gemmatimonadaceae bacterium]